ncbi:hypothetical protein D3C87_1112680 [compost metagenome]
MSRRVAQRNRVAQAIGVRVDAAATERAQRIRAVKAFRSRVVGAVTTAEQVPAVVFAYFAIERPQAEHRLVAVALAVGTVDGSA